MSNNRAYKNKEEHQAGWFFLPADVVKQIGLHYLSIDELKNLSLSCHFFNRNLKQVLARKQMIMFHELLQAIIDDNRPRVKNVLDAQPSLLLIQLNKGIVMQSKLTWQSFRVHSAMQIATKRRQLRMIELMLPYLDLLRTKCKTADEHNRIINIKALVVNEWDKYEITKDSLGYPVIAMPQTYIDVFKYLIEVIGEEEFYSNKPSSYTEDVLSTFYDCLINTSEEFIEEYQDPEMLLYAACKYYEADKSTALMTRRQTNLFCIRVIGLIESFLSPESGFVLLKGIHDLIVEKKECNEFDECKKFISKCNYYYRKDESRIGLGFDFYLGMDGLPAATTSGWIKSSLVYQFICEKINRHAELVKQYHCDQGIKKSSACLMM